MEKNARIFAAIFILFSILCPLASASFFSEVVRFFIGKESTEEDLDSESRVRMSIKTSGSELPLRIGFYQETCPQAEEIVKDVISEASKKNPGVLAGLLRLHFHDCFVKGCEASILLDKTPSGEKTEKISPANGFTLRGFEVIDRIKAELEEACPGIVSCADILAFGARDSLNLSGLPSYQVPGGRRDGHASLEVDVVPNLPAPRDSIENITTMFVRKGLTIEDMVVLTGAHSIGISHCGNFAYRPKLPNADKELDGKLLSDIKSTCKEVKSRASLPFDSFTEYKMDTEFYKQLLENKGLIESDQKMAQDLKTSDYVKKLAADQQGWFEKFARSMVRLGTTEVLTGKQGEIRKQCRFVN